MTSTLYQFNDFHEFYNFTDCCNWGPSGVSNKEICSCCESVPYKDISFLLTETEIIDKTPNDWAEWKGDKDEEHIPEFIEDLGFKELGDTGYYWNPEKLEEDGDISNIRAIIDLLMMRVRFEKKIDFYKEEIEDDEEVSFCGVNGHRCEECTDCARSKVCDTCKCVGGCYEDCLSNSNYFSGDSRGPQIKMKLNSGWILEHMEDWWRSRAEDLRKGEGNEPCVEEDLEFDEDIVFERITQRVSNWFDCDNIFRGCQSRLFNSNTEEDFYDAIREEFDELEEEDVITQIL